MSTMSIIALAEAIAALHGSGYENVTEEANKQNKRADYAVFSDPSGIGIYYCADEADVLDLAIELGLVEGEQAQ